MEFTGAYTRRSGPRFEQCFLVVEPCKEVVVATCHNQETNMILIKICHCSIPICMLLSLVCETTHNLNRRSGYVILNLQKVFGRSYHHSSFFGGFWVYALRLRRNMHNHQQNIESSCRKITAVDRKLWQVLAARFLPCFHTIPQRLKPWAWASSMGYESLGIPLIYNLTCVRKIR